jgi:hypothetical protein
MGFAVRLWRGDDGGPPDIVVVSETWMPAFLSTRYSLWSPARATPFIALFVQLTNRWLFPIRSEFVPWDYVGPLEFGGLTDFGLFNCIWIITLQLWVILGAVLVYECSTTYHWSEANAMQTLLLWKLPWGSYNYAYPAWPCVEWMVIFIWLIGLIVALVGIWLIIGDSEPQPQSEQYTHTCTHPESGKLQCHIFAAK